MGQRSHGERRRRTLAAVLLLLCAMAPAAASAGEALPPIPPPADLAGMLSPGQLNRHFLATQELPEDGALPFPRPARILSLPPSEWRPAWPAKNIQSHFKTSRGWLLGEVLNSSDRPVTRSLALQPWRLARVTFHELDPLSRRVLRETSLSLEERFSSGTFLSVEATHTLTLEPGERRLLLISAEAASYGALILSAADPDRLAESRTHFFSYSLVLFGIVLGLVFLLLSQRTAGLALTAGWLLATTSFELSYLRPVLPILLALDVSYLIALYAILGAFSASLFALGTVALFSGPATRRWLLVLGALSLLILIGSSSPLWTESHVPLRKLASRLMLIVLLLTPLAVYQTYRRSGRPGKPMLLGLSMAIWTLAALRVGVAAGMLPTMAEHDPIMLGYIPVLALLVLALLVTDLRSRTAFERSLAEERQRLESEQQEYLLGLERSENARLSAAVEERTRQLKLAKQRAEESSRAKSLFLSGISHELRAPLHDVLGYVGLALRQVRGREARQLEVVERRGQELLNMINDLLEFVRGETPSLTLAQGPVNLRELVGHLELAHENLAREQNNTLSTEVDLSAGDWVLADEQRLSQLLGNLLQNACRYTSDGRIRLQARTFAGTQSAEAPQGIADDARDDFRVQFIVSDTGIGIPVADQARVFEAFERGDSSRYAKGTGLGLGIVRQLVAAMEGTIELESDPARAPGTTFTVTLPMKPCLGDLATAADEAPEADGGRQPTILIIDDEESHRSYLASLCELWQIHSLQAASAEEGIALLESRAVTIDTVVIDQCMPGCNAWQFLQRIRVQPAFAELPVILVSTVAPEPPEEQVSGNSFQAYVRKPYTPESIAAILSLYVHLPEDLVMDESESGKW